MTKTWTRRITPGHYKVCQGNDNGGRFVIGRQIGTVMKCDDKLLPWQAISNTGNMTTSSTHRTLREAVAELAARATEGQNG
jgi:hypothetical protein